MTEPSEKETGSTAPAQAPVVVVSESDVPVRRKLFPNLLALAGKKPNPHDAERNRRIALMRTRILHEMQAHGWRRLGVLPLTRGAGATTVTLELTWAILRQPAIHATLVDLDFTGPQIARELGLPGCSPISDELRRGGNLDGLLVSVHDQPALQVLAPAAPDNHGAEILQSPAFSEALNQLIAAQKSDYVLFDLAPLLGTDVGLSAIAHLDAVLLVADGHTTQAKDMQEAERLLADDVPLMGVVLNKSEG